MTSVLFVTYFCKVLIFIQIYRVCGQSVLCYPLLFEVSDFYLAQDMSVVLDDLKVRGNKILYTYKSRINSDSN